MRRESGEREYGGIAERPGVCGVSGEEEQGL